MKTRFLFAYCVSAVVGAALAYEGSAEATNQRYPAAFCQEDSDLTNADYVAASGSPYDGSGLMNASASHAYWHCPVLDIVPDVDDGDGLEHNEVTTVNVHGYDGSAAVSVNARVCYQDYNTTGGDCDSIDSSGAGTTGIFTISLTGTEIDIWGTNGSDFAYVQMHIEGSDTSSQIYGYWVQG